MSPTKVNAGAVLAVVCAATFFGVLNASAVNVVLPEIGAGLVVEPALLGWAISLFLLVYGIAIPFYGRLAERFGSRPLFIVGILLFGLGSAACAFAPSIETLLAARALQGLGGAAFPGLGMALVSGTASPERRGTSLGVVAATLGAGAAAGPLIGGALAELVSWRLLFGASALALAVLPFAWRHLPSEHANDERFDIWGGLCLALGVAASLFTVAESGRAGPTAPVLATGAVVPVAMALVVWRQRVRRPFLPTALVRSRPYLAAVGMAFCATFIYLSVLVAVPLMLSEFAGLSPLQVGVVLLPGAITTAVGGVLAGRLVDRLGARLPTLAGATIVGSVALLLSCTPGDQVFVASFAAAGLALGYAMLNTPIAAAIGEMVEPGLAPSAMSINAMVFFVGGSFGTAATVAISTLPIDPAVAVNPFHSGPGAGFSNAFAALVLPAIVCGALSFLIPGRAPRH